MNNMFLDNYTVEQIIEYGRNMKDKTAGRKWTERVLKEKAQREVELAKIAVQEKKQEKYREFYNQENKSKRIERTDEQKERTCKIYANKYDLNLDELIKIQKDICEEYRRNQAPEEEVEIDFGFEEMER